MKVHFQASEDLTLCGIGVGTVETTVDVLGVTCKRCMEFLASGSQRCFVVGGSAFCMRCGEDRDLRQDGDGVWYCCLCADLVKEMVDS